MNYAKTRPLQLMYCVLKIFLLFNLRFPISASNLTYHVEKIQSSSICCKSYKSSDSSDCGIELEAVINNEAGDGWIFEPLERIETDVTPIGCFGIKDKTRTNFI